MRSYCTAFLLLLFTVSGIHAQKVEVPSSIRFADMQLDLSATARKKIQTDVDALLRSEKYFLLKLKKVDLHFPLIEQVLKEENVPDDMKYLVIQESALVGDAVSTSNAIGYWQFKEAAAREVGLAINHAVDERMNIITATRGAARYLKSNNTFFNNWLYALLAYNTGPGGALRLVDKSQYGVKHMHLKGDTHWYVLKFLAHKVAFENAVGKNPHSDIQLFAYNNGKGKTLHEIAEEFKLEKTDLEPYNRWLKARRVPDDKEYFVIIPSFDKQPAENLLAQAEIKTDKPEEEEPHEYMQASNQSELTPATDTRRFPVIKTFSRRGAEVKINGIPGIIAQEGDDIRAISERTGITASRFVAYNDLTSKNSSVIPGKPYYIRRKRNRGAARYHTAEAGETLWSISQRFGMKLKKLIRNNRMREEETIKPGRVLWLRYIRPASFPIEYREVDTPSQQKSADEVISTRPEPGITAPEMSTPSQEEKKSLADQGSRDKDQQKKAEEVEREPVNRESYESWESVKQTEQAKSVQSSPPPAKEKTKTPPVTEEEFDTSDVVFVETTDSSMPPLPHHHIVQKDESLYSIARQYSITIPQIRQYNDLEPDATLHIGQKLLLKAPETSKTSQEPKAELISYVYHEVQSGDTLYQIARSYGVTIKDLIEWNDKDNFNVSIGERLKIAKPAQK